MVVTRFDVREGRTIEAPKTPSGVGYGEGVPSPSDYGVWGHHRHIQSCAYGDSKCAALHTTSIMNYIASRMTNAKYRHIDWTCEKTSISINLTSSRQVVSCSRLYSNVSTSHDTRDKLHLIKCVVNTTYSRIYATSSTCLHADLLSKSR